MKKQVPKTAKIRSRKHSQFGKHEPTLENSNDKFVPDLLQREKQINPEFKKEMIQYIKGLNKDQSKGAPSFDKLFYESITEY